MIKKLFILGLILAVVGVATIPLWTQKLAEEAFAHPKRKGSSKRIKDAVVVKFRIHNFKETSKLAERGIIYFPESRYLPEFLYYAARSAAQRRKPHVAIYWYERFLNKFPDHQWSNQSKSAMEKLKELHVRESL